LVLNRRMVVRWWMFVKTHVFFLIGVCVETECVQE
jgi:hypothetical protein